MIKVSSTEKFHIETKDPWYNMMDETTLSHLLRYKNEFTSTKMPYGGQLFDALYQKGLVPEEPKVLEVGIGLGHVTDRFNERMTYIDPELGKRSDYTMVDLSKKLAYFSKSRFSQTNNVGVIQADALNLPVKPGSRNLVISNEIMADLPTVTGIPKEKLKADVKGSASEGGIYGDTVRMFKKYGLDFSDAPKEFSFNYGAVKLLREFSRMLPSGGNAFISEYSTDNVPCQYPVPVKLMDHTEYPVKFSHLNSAAQKLGFHVEEGRVQDFLKIDSKKAFVTPEYMKNLHIGLIKKRARVAESNQNDKRIDSLSKLVVATAIQAYSIDQFQQILDAMRDQGEPIPDLRGSIVPFESFSKPFRYLLLTKK